MRHPGFFCHDYSLCLGKCRTYLALGFLFLVDAQCEVEFDKAGALFERDSQLESLDEMGLRR